MFPNRSSDYTGTFSGISYDPYHNHNYDPYYNNDYDYCYNHNYNSYYDNDYDPYYNHHNDTYYNHDYDAHYDNDHDPYYDNDHDPYYNHHYDPYYNHHNNYYHYYHSYNHHCYTSECSDKFGLLDNGSFDYRSDEKERKWAMFDLACQTCAKDLMDVTPQGGAGEIEFDSDVIDNSGTCATRTLVCVGRLATIEFNLRALGTVSGATMAMQTFTCNDAGTAWIIAPLQTPVTISTCAVISFG